MLLMKKMFSFLNPFKLKFLLNASLMTLMTSLSHFLSQQHLKARKPLLVGRKLTTSLQAKVRMFSQFKFHTLKLSPLQCSGK